MQFRTSVDGASLLWALRGVLASHATSSCCGGVGVRSRTLTFDSMASGWYGTSPAPPKSAQTFSVVNTWLNAALKGLWEGLLVEMKPDLLKLHTSSSTIPYFAFVD